MPAPDPFANLSPGITAASAVTPRNERRRTPQPVAWKAWVWPVLGLLGGAVAAVATRLPLLTVPPMDAASYAQDNAARALAVLICAALAGILCILRWFRPSLLCNGMAAGLLLASGLEKYRDFQTMRESTHVAPGAGEMAQQAAAFTAKLLAGIRPEIAAYLLPAGVLLGIAAGLLGRRKAEEGRESRKSEVGTRK